MIYNSYQYHNHQEERHLFITCTPDEWVLTAKDEETLQQLHSNHEDVKVSGNIDKYAKRPNSLEDWS